MTAARSGSVAAIEAVLNNMGTEAATANNFAYTATVSSIFDGHSPVTNVLISRTGLDIDQKGVTGNTLLMWASLWGRYDIAETLLAAGADFMVTNKDGDTALSIAAKAGNRDIVVLLRSYGAV